MLPASPHETRPAGAGRQRFRAVESVAVSPDEQEQPLAFPKPLLDLAHLVSGALTVDVFQDLPKKGVPNDVGTDAGQDHFTHIFAAQAG